VENNSFPSGMNFDENLIGATRTESKIENKVQRNREEGDAATAAEEQLKAIPLLVVYHFYVRYSYGSSLRLTFDSVDQQQRNPIAPIAFL